MKPTGYVMRIDRLGRVTIPKFLRESLNFEEHQPLEFGVDDRGGIVLMRHYKRCIFCGGKDNLEYFEGRFVCTKCKEELINGGNLNGGCK